MPHPPLHGKRLKDNLESEMEKEKCMTEFQNKTGNEKSLVSITARNNLLKSA